MHNRFASESLHGIFRLLAFSVPCLAAWRSLLWFEFSTLCLLASSELLQTRFQHVIVLFPVVLGRVELPTSTLSV